MNFDLNARICMNFDFNARIYINFDSAYILQNGSELTIYCILLTVIGSWVILDPKVGGWLMDSDHPPVTFQQTAIALKVPLSQVGLHTSLL